MQNQISKSMTWSVLYVLDFFVLFCFVVNFISFKFPPPPAFLPSYPLPSHFHSSPKSSQGSLPCGKSKVLLPPFPLPLPLQFKEQSGFPALWEVQGPPCSIQVQEGAQPHRDRGPHWSTGLNSQGPNEEQKEGEYEQGSQDHEGCAHPLRRWGWSNGSSPRPAGLGLKNHRIKLNSLNMADNEGWLRCQGQWHWVLILLHVLALWEPSLFGCAPSWTWMEGGGPWSSHRAGNPDCSLDWRGRGRGAGEGKGNGR